MFEQFPNLANALLLPYCMERNLVGNLKKFRQIAQALGENTDGMTDRQAAQAAADAVFQLARDLHVPMKLKDVGVTREMFPEIIKGTMEYRLLAVNPCKLTEKDVEEILLRAFE